MTQQTANGHHAASLVFLPGLLSDAIVWQPAADHFAPQIPIAIADLSAGTSLTQMAQTVLAENDGPLYVVGHSMGARAALEMVRLAPERIKKLALVDTGIHPKKEGEEAKRQVMLDLAANEGMQALADKWLPPMVHEARHDDTDLMNALNDMVLRADEAQHERQIKALINRPDGACVLPNITCPVLLAVGRQDGWSPPEQHEEMLAMLKDARLVVIEDAGHFAPIERPQGMIAALDMWLKGWGNEAQEAANG